MKRTILSSCIGAGLLMAGASVHLPALAGPMSVRYDGLVLKSDAGDDHLNLEARVSTRWGRAQAQLSAARDGDGGLDGTTRAWWQSDLAEYDTSLRLGSQQVAATLLRSAVDLTGLGLSGRLAPAVLDYALSVGRLDERAGGLPAAAAWLQRRLGEQGALALHALQVGRALEVGAALDTAAAWPGLGRWSLVQLSEPGAARTRLVSDQRISWRGALLQARADRVVSGCSSQSGAGLVLQRDADGCLSMSADAAIDVLPQWQMQLGSSYRVRADDSTAQQAFVGAVWQTKPGLRLSLSLHHRSEADGGQALGASLTYPLKLSF